MGMEEYRPADVDEQQIDDYERERLEKQLHEASERATFHRVEAERWERVGRAAGAGLKALNDPVPVTQVTPESLIGDGGVRAAVLPYQHDQAVPHPAGARSEGGLSHP